mmetsp:Transcript_95106/g.272004  ORF Transcript_95106/g.272004 Transcript_95106/m.272004 type:complete len:742 (+) Transcript_95106:320-2545(+)
MSAADLKMAKKNAEGEKTERAGRGIDDEEAKFVYKKDNTKGTYENEDIYNQCLGDYLSRFRPEVEIENDWMRKYGRNTPLQREIRTAPAKVRGTRGNMAQIADMNSYHRQRETMVPFGPAAQRAAERAGTAEGGKRKRGRRRSREGRPSSRDGDRPPSRDGSVGSNDSGDESDNGSRSSSRDGSRPGSAEGSRPGSADENGRPVSRGTNRRQREKAAAGIRGAIEHGQWNVTQQSFPSSGHVPMPVIPNRGRMAAPAAVRQRTRKEKLQKDLKEAASQRLVDQQASDVGILQLKQKYRAKMLIDAMQTFDGNITDAQRAALEAQANEPIAAQGTRGPRKPKARPKSSFAKFRDVLMSVPAMLKKNIDDDAAAVKAFGNRDNMRKMSSRVITAIPKDLSQVMAMEHRAAERLMRSASRMEGQLQAAQMAASHFGQAKEYLTAEDLVARAGDGILPEVIKVLDQRISRGSRRKGVQVNDVAPNGQTALYACFLSTLQDDEKKAKKKKKKSGKRNSTSHQDARGRRGGARLGLDEKHELQRVKKSGKPEFDESLEELLGRGADLNFTETSVSGEGWSILHHAAARGNLPRVKWILENGGSVDTRSNSGTTPLMEAAKRGKLKVCLHLLTSRANIDIQDEQGASALHHAAKSGTVKTVKLLLVAGAERRCHDRNQKTPIDWAEEYKRPHALEVLRLEWEEMGRDGDGWKGIGSTRIYAYTHTRIHARTPSISFCLSCIHMHAHTQ